MDILTAIFSDDGVQRTLAGSAGGLARVLFLIVTDKELPRRQSVALVILGALLGLFASPSLEDILGGTLTHLNFRADPERLPVLTAFVTGGFSIALIGIAIDFVKNRFQQPTHDAGVDPDPKQLGDKP